jgi:predicted  nucleic acid-binding Zn-ribbon protein
MTMTDIPFHVAGGLFAAKKPPKPEIDASFLNRPQAELPEAVTSSRRRRLWEVPHKFHCPVVGTCFEVKELRTLMHKVMHLPRDTSDFVLHTTAVGACETRTVLAELLHKTLEKRYAPIVRRFAASKTAEGVRHHWREAVANGMELPGALWAAWTHPACDSLLEHEIYGDIHMIQHQVGTGTRADLKALQALRAENTELRRQLDTLRQEAEATRNEKACETRALGERLTELRAEQAGRDACIARLSADLAKLRDSLPELRQRQALARRAEDAEARASALAAQCREQAETLERLRRRVDELDNIAPAPVATLPSAHPHASTREAAVESLDGKCVLCVGGRSGAMDAYRDAVERQGGRFLHHDGGLEESLHRIDGALAAADLVICQTGCISHNAYWRVKEQCKRTGKPCLFVKRGGVSNFGRILADLCAEETAGAATD